jgi:membrane protease YdiL (CAAX protease family)
MKKELTMDKNDRFPRQVALKGWLLIGGAILLIVSGLVITSLSPADTRPYTKLTEGIGIFLLGTGIWYLWQYFSFKRNPTSLMKARAESMDERKLWIRYRSGNNAFMYGITVTYLALLLSGIMEGEIPVDYAWRGLAFIVVSTMIVYIISMVHFEGKY